MATPADRIWDVLDFLPWQQSSSNDFYYIPAPLSTTATDAEREHRIAVCWEQREKVLGEAIAVVDLRTTDPLAITQFHTTVRQMCALGLAIGAQNLQTRLGLTSSQAVEVLPPEILDMIFFTAMAEEHWNASRLTFRLLNSACARLLSRENTKYWTHMSLGPLVSISAIEAQRSFFEARCLPILEVNLRVDRGQDLDPKLWEHLRGNPAIGLSPMLGHCRNLTIIARWTDAWRVFGNSPLLPSPPPGLEVLQLVCLWDLDERGYPEEPESAEDAEIPMPPLLVPSIQDPTRLREIKLYAIEYIQGAWDWSLMVNLETLDFGRISSGSFTLENFYEVLQVATRLRTLRLWEWWPLDKLAVFSTSVTPIHVHSLEEIAFGHMDDSAIHFIMGMMYPKNLKRLLLQGYGNSDDESWLTLSDSPTNVFSLTHLVIDIDEAWFPFRDVFNAQPMLEILDIRAGESEGAIYEVVENLIDALQDPELLKHLRIVDVRFAPNSAENKMMKEAGASIVDARPGLRLVLSWIPAHPEDMGEWWGFKRVNM